MPEITAYGTSIHSSTGTWTTTANVLGAPDGTETSSTTSGGILRVRVAGFSGLPDTAVINRVYVGVRSRLAATTVALTLVLLTGTSTVDATPLLDSGAQTLTVTHDAEFERPGSGFTVAGLKDVDFRIQMTRAANLGASNIDAVWVRVVYDEAPTLITSYLSTVVSAGSWTVPANMIGPPDGNTNNVAVNNAATSYKITGFSTVAADATFTRVVLGMRARVNGAAGSISLQLSSSVGTVDTAVKVWTSTDVLWAVPEFEMNASLFTAAAIKNPDLLATITRGTTGGTMVVDAVWVRVLPAVAGTSRAKRWSGSAWIDAPIKRWSGTAWVTTTIKRWDGSAWV